MSTSDTIKDHGQSGYSFEVDKLPASDFKQHCFMLCLSGERPLHNVLTESPNLERPGQLFLEVGGFYFHISYDVRKGRNCPHVLSFAELTQYMKAYDKVIYYRERVNDIRDPKLAKQALANRLAEDGEPARDPNAFHSEIVRAGGSTWDLRPHEPDYGPLRYGIGFVDPAASSGHSRVAHAQKRYWPLEAARRYYHEGYKFYADPYVSAHPGMEHKSAWRNAPQLPGKPYPNYLFNDNAFLFMK